MVRNPSTGESRGFGFVIMTDDKDVDDVCLPPPPPPPPTSPSEALRTACAARFTHACGRWAPRTSVLFSSSLPDICMAGTLNSKTSASVSVRQDDG